MRFTLRKNSLIMLRSMEIELHDNLNVCGSTLLFSNAGITNHENRNRFLRSYYEF